MGYVYSLLTNIGVLIGVLSFFFWIGEVTNPRIAKYTDYFEIAVGVVYTGYVFGLSLLNTHTNSILFGRHWLALNLALVAVFMFNFMVANRVQFVVSAVTITGYLLLSAERFQSVIFLTLAIMLAVLWELTEHGFEFWNSRLHVYGLEGVYHLAALLTMKLTFDSVDDVWFWARQLGALAFFSVMTYEFCRLLIVRRKKANDDRLNAMFDGLTGVHNFETFNRDLHELFDKTRSANVTYALLEIDIDWFKGVNDSYGHLTGNEVLRRVAKTMAAFATALPGTATVYRLGGEEFCLIVQAAEGSPIDLVAMAREIKTQIDALSFSTKNAEFAVTVSIGGDEVKQTDRTYLDSYQHADHSLYAAKRAGRDRINIGGQVVS